MNPAPWISPPVAGESRDMADLSPVAGWRAVSGPGRYLGHHRRVRAFLRPVVAAGEAVCVRCGEPIAADEPWDLGHSDAVPDRYAGPEHARCNRSAGARSQQRKASRVW